jgi:hypothetical protein
VTIVTTSKNEDSNLPVVNILKAADGPLTTRELQAEVRKTISFCPSASVIGLNLLRIAGTIKGKRLPDRKGWIWWIEE